MGNKKPAVDPELLEKQLKKVGFVELKMPHQDGKFAITCRSCDGKGWCMVFGGPDQNPCKTCGGLGVQYVDKLTADEWRRKRKLITGIKGVCKDCGSWHKKTGLCDIIEDETIEGDTSYVIRHSPAERTYLNNFERERQPNDSCSEFNPRRKGGEK